MAMHSVSHALAAHVLSCHVSKYTVITLIHQPYIAPMLFDPCGGNMHVLAQQPLCQSGVWCSAAYIVALLHDGFKLGMQERRLRFTNYVEDPQGNSMDIDWTLGDSPGCLLHPKANDTD